MFAITLVVSACTTHKVQTNISPNADQTNTDSRGVVLEGKDLYKYFNKNFGGIFNENFDASEAI